MKNATKAQATAVLNQVSNAFDATDGFGPTLVQNFDGRAWTLMWEGGPTDWVYQVSGVVTVPGVWTEPVNNYSVAIWPK